MRNIVRQPVTGDDFFPRPKVVKKIRKALDAKLPILLTGPVKSGKTSLLFHLRDTLEEYHLHYINAKALTDRSNFYLTIFHSLNSIFTIKTAIDRDINVKATIVNMLQRFSSSTSVVIIIDDYYLFLTNIYKKRGRMELVEFLEEDKKFRSLVETNVPNIRFIYTSTFDINNISTKFDANDTINDFYLIHIPALSTCEGEELVKELSGNFDFRLNRDLVRYLLDKLQWLTPFQIQVLLFELDYVYINKDLAEINHSAIDEAFGRVLGHKDYFECWESHLKTFFDEDEYNFIQDQFYSLLQSPWESYDNINKKEVTGYYNLRGRGSRIIDSLVSDGYLEKNEINNTYRFKSQLFKAWWSEQLFPGSIVGPFEDLKKPTNEFKQIKIRQISIKQIKCFQDVDIKFDTTFNTTVIIGTNGKGKSTILQLIALALSGVTNVPFTYNWKEVVKKGAPKGQFELSLQVDGKPLQLTFEINAENDTITCTKGKKEIASLRDSFTLLAYGVNRSIKLEETKPYKNIEPIATLFGENGYLKHIKLSSTYESVSNHFTAIQPLINKVLQKANGGDNVVMTHFDSSGFYFKTPSNPKDSIPIEALSEGYKSSLVWLLDAVIRIVEKGGRLENAANVTGVILLDEIDLHLHPSWQRTILKSVESLFPNIQFIVTTHSPFVLQSTKKECFVTLETDKKTGNITAVDKNITSELSYGAIVREVFNVGFPFSHEVEVLMDRFREIADALRDKKDIDVEVFKELVRDIASRGAELEGIMRREMMNLEKRTGKTFDLWKK